MKKILEKSGNFVRGKKWEPCSWKQDLSILCCRRYWNSKVHARRKFAISSNSFTENNSARSLNSSDFHKTFQMKERNIVPKALQRRGIASCTTHTSGIRSLGNLPGRKTRKCIPLSLNHVLSVYLNIKRCSNTFCKVFPPFFEQRA